MIEALLRLTDRIDEGVEEFRRCLISIQETPLNRSSNDEDNDSLDETELDYLNDSMSSIDIYFGEEDDSGSGEAMSTIFADGIFSEISSDNESDDENIDDSDCDDYEIVSLSSWERYIDSSDQSDNSSF